MRFLEDLHRVSLCSVESSTSRVSLTRKVHFNKTIPTTVASVAEIMAVFYAVSRELTTVKSTVLGHEIREFEYFRVQQCIINVSRIGGTDGYMLSF